MRAGACAAQTLSPEAASVLKHSLSLARRRGHAQLTPLHVAATLLSSRPSLLKRACLKSQPHHQPSHPLQSRALELCFNVALNRLPASPGPLLHAQPALSNALVAALKRAQAHQRRGSIEQNQQQPLIAIKVELEQLILSILDDPSVSRVMREAGFSSTSVKNNLEESNSVSSVFQCYNSTPGGIFSTPSSSPTEAHHQREFTINPNSFWQNPHLFSPQKKPVSTDEFFLKEDIKVVLEVLLGKKRKNTVIVGDSLSMAEVVVAELMRNLEKGEVPDELKSVKIVKFQLSSVPLMFMKRDEVDMNVADLKRKVESLTSCGGVIIYIGDLKWTVERVGDDDEISAGNESNVYSRVDYLIAEIGKLVSWFNYSSSYMRVWLMATANYRTYMKCQMRQPPLDVQWALQAVSVPSGGLGLSLSGRDSRTSFPQSPSQVTDRKLFCLKEDQDVLTCCPDCKSNYEKEASFKSIHHKSFPINKDEENGSAHFPYLLKQHSDEAVEEEALSELREKYNKFCQSLHQHSQNLRNSSSVVCGLGRNYDYTSSYSCGPNKNNILANSETVSFAYPTMKPNQTIGSLPRFRRKETCHIEFSFSNGNSKLQTVEPNLDSEVKITLALGNSIYADARAHDKIGVDKDLLGIFQENVPWQSETIPLILEALMDSEGTSQDKFLLIQGKDVVGKQRIAAAVAKSMFGSSDLLFCMNMRSDANTVAENREILEKALRDHEKLVVLVEDVDYADPEFSKFLADAFLEAGKQGSWRRHTRDSSQAVFILTMDGDSGYCMARDNVNSVIQMKLLVNESKFVAVMPNVVHKRKAEWDFPIRGKSRRSNEMDEVSSNAVENARQLSSNALDLNVKAEDDEADEGKLGTFSPISSDLTRETTIIEQQSSLSFLKKIKNCFVLNRNSEQDKQAREMFMSKFRRSFQEANISSFNIDETVLEEVFQGSGFYLNSLFDQWLKDVFETSLRMIDTGEKEKVSIRPCLGWKGESSCPKDGFMGTCLPRRIPLSFIG
ncbi:protein SMAX1-LIKE 4 [Sesamum indicum]|uniref:Protein SMAX1-LIKE 4 n=1 Tax=Sesamum indicum TaxID=4182 RepID=A0A6I9T2I8_SESIN|nr:protein SMAX1-LIKE 4 [Sesamum indicum]